MTRRLVPLLALVTVLAGAAPLAARAARQTAQRCGSTHIVIYSQQALLAPVLTRTGYFVPDANKDLWCVNAGKSDAPYDLRVIAPGSTMVQVRVFGARNPGRLTLSGIVNARGIRMSFVPPAPPVRGGAFYDSPWIPLDPTKSGTLTAKLNASTGSTVYHTVE
jgi:hypothetical protein